jgi:putative endonuclease
MKHYTYMVRCADGSLYTGYATDVARRVAEHNGEAGHTGSKYTRARRPVVLVYQEAHASRSEAQKREAAIKQLTRLQKEGLCETESCPRR